jgi:hypothetical protein
MSYLAAGVLDQASLRRSIEADWAEFFAGEDEFLKAGSSLLVIGVGSGRDVLPLLEAG